MSGRECTRVSQMTKLTTSGATWITRLKSKQIERLTMAAVQDQRSAARIRIVQEHLQFENRHDLNGIMETFGAEAFYNDEPWNDHRVGRDAVRTYYEQLMKAVPDLVIEVRQQFASSEAVTLLGVVSGTHEGNWRGLPGTGRRLKFPLCAVYTFNEAHKIVAETIYYDRATVLAQVGLFHDPTTFMGRLMIPIAHPLTLTKALWRQLVRR
jgi:steroid delta-isomerase-like uncharacterized protein